MRKCNKPWWILDYNKRKYVSGKYRATEKEISEKKTFWRLERSKKIKIIDQKSLVGYKKIQRQISHASEAK